MNIMSIYYHADSIILINNYKKVQAEQQNFFCCSAELFIKIARSLYYRPHDGWTVIRNVK